MPSSFSSSTSPVVPPPARRLRILYADDMEELRRLFSIVLKLDGHTIETVPDGEDAINLLAADPRAFDLVITDHHMPRVNGLELVRRLREMRFKGPIIVFSSELDLGVDDAYRTLGVDHIIAKPVIPNELRIIVGSL